MTADDVARLAGRGEGPTLEFKNRTPEPARLAKEIIAFANTSGGRLIIGVDDDGSVVGVKDSTEEEFALRNALDAHCQPSVSYRTERIEITRKRDVIVVAVPRSRKRPHFLVGLNGRNNGVAYVRVNDRSVEASPETVALMEASLDDTDVQFEFTDVELRLMKYLEEFGQVSVSFFSRMAGIDTEKAGNVLVTLTRAGVLAHHLDVDGDYFTLTFEAAN